MTRIETYSGTTDALVDFVNEVWTRTYAGKMTIPCWTVPYFQWQFRLDRESSAENLIAAYDGDVLTGVLLGTDYPFRSPAGLHRGSHWSWLSIRPEYQGRGIAKGLHQERVVRQTAVHSRLISSFRYVGSPHSKAERPRNGVRDDKFNRKLGFWARVIDPERFSKWHWNGVEGFLAKLASPFTQIPASAKSNSSVRPFTIDDIGRCLSLAQDNYSSAKLSIAWDHDSLLHQLSGNEISQTLVLEEGGLITGFVNFHVLEFRAKTVERVAVLDLIVLGHASSKGRIRLLNAALARMQDQGVILTLKLRCGDVPSWPMLRTHFVPQLPDSFLVLQPVGETFSIPKSGPIHLLWR